MKHICGRIKYALVIGHTVTALRRSTLYRRLLLMSALLLFAVALTLACERPTKIFIEGGNPPTFRMTGNGSLRAIRVRGPKKQREAEGEEASFYWYIKSEKGGAKNVEDVGQITYGKVPEGYVQVYPERGEAPPLIEGERYLVRVSTVNANGADKVFSIRSGKVVDISDY